MPQITRTAVLLLLLLVTALLLLVLMKMPYMFDFHGIRWIPAAMTERRPENTLTLAPMVDLSARVPDPLAGSAPLLTDVGQQKEAVKTLQRKLHHDPPQYKCQNPQLITNVKEGKRRYCKDKGFDIKPPCLVYSFGIAYDFKFDDTFGQMGCDVFSFDPSMNTPDHRRSSQVMFYQIGLGGADNDSYVPRLDGYVKEKTTWRMRTLKSLMAMLNHTTRTIDVLKLDIECSEWASVRNMLDSGVLSRVKQLLVEWHIFWNCPERDRLQQLIALLNDLSRAGFKVFERMPNWTDLSSWGKTFRLQSDVGYVNTRFKKP